MTTEKTPEAYIRLNKVTHTIRTAQAVLQYGVGAMVDFPDQTLMTSAPEYWEDRIVHIHDERLEKSLGVDFFGMPGGKDEYPNGIAYVRFPEWYFCPKCRTFQSLDEWVKEYQKKATSKQKEKDPYMRKPRCLECKKDLVPTRIVVACEEGHIDDFPWIRWVHDKNAGGQKPICGNSVLTFETGATASAGLEGLVVRCKTCEARATLYGAFDKDALSRLGQNYACSGFMPWKGKHVACGRFPQAVQRGASKIYFPKVVSSLVIPPYSDKVNSLIENSQRFRECLTFIAECDDEERESKIEARLDRWAVEIATQIAVAPESVKYILRRKLLDKENNKLDDVYNAQYRVEEYEALIGKVDQKQLASSDFIREDMDAKAYDIPGIKGIALIHKVREVRALTGFTRLNPPSSFKSAQNQSGFVSIKEPKTRWYPAYEVRGEGIFMEFDDHAIRKWVEDTHEVSKRVDCLNENYSASYQGGLAPRDISPKFVLLHTVAHLLIRQLSFECGYTAASLRERIYCDDGQENYKMSGILIYTASGDAEGTLGGLVRQGYPDCLPRLFKKAIETGELCSNDPVCIQSQGQGREAMNLAACHACLLLPETSCEEFNVLLDRGLVVGTFEDKSIGFCSK